MILFETKEYSSIILLKSHELDHSKHFLEGIKHDLQHHYLFPMFFLHYFQGPCLVPKIFTKSHISHHIEFYGARIEHSI